MVNVSATGAVTLMLCLWEFWIWPPRRSDSARESVICGVCPDFGLERPECCRRVDDQELSARHAGVVLERFKADSGGHGGMVCRSGGQPGGGGSGEVRSWLPDGAADGQLRQGGGR